MLSSMMTTRLPSSIRRTGFSLSFTPTISGAYGLSFAGTGGDNMGMLLDNVKVAAIPEPQTYALLALGLVLGATMRRRQR